MGASGRCRTTKTMTTITQNTLEALRHWGEQHEARYILTDTASLYGFLTSSRDCQSMDDELKVLLEGRGSLLPQRAYRHTDGRLQRSAMNALGYASGSENHLRVILAAARAVDKGVLLVAPQGKVYLLSQHGADATRVKEMARQPYHLSKKQEEFDRCMQQWRQGVALLSEIKGGQPLKTYEVNATNINLQIA